MNDTYISVQTAAKMMGQCDQAIRNHVAAGRLPAERIGMRRYYRIKLADLRALAEKYNYPLNEEALEIQRN